MTATPIRRLLFCCRPFAIIRLIAKIVVYAFNRKPKRFSSHVCKEILKAEPAFTHCNPTRSIIAITGSARIPAPIQHSRPCLIFSRPMAFTTVPMSWFSSVFERRDTSTPARLSVPHPKRVISDKCDVSTITLTPTASGFFSAAFRKAGRIRDYNKASKSLSDQRYSCGSRHGIGSFNVVFGCASVSPGRTFEFMEFGYVCNPK